MMCPSCSSYLTSVLDTRPTDTGSIRRRRRCDDCAHRFRTYEVVAPAQASLISVLGVVSRLDDDDLVDAIAGHTRAAVRAVLRKLRVEHTDDDDMDLETTEPQPGRVQ